MVLLTLLAGAALIIWTVAVTAMRYRELPSRVPIHFGITGVADSYGPRPLIWIPVAVQLLFAAVYGIRYAFQPNSTILAIGTGALAILLWAQIEILSAAVTGKNRVSPALLWGIFLAIIVAIVVAARRAL